MSYSPPIAELQFSLLNSTRALTHGGGSLDEDVLAAILEQAGSFASDVLLPLDKVLDRSGASYASGRVTTASGHRDAYAQFTGGGWSALSLPSQFGGQDLPLTLNAACLEMWHAGSIGFTMGLLLNMGAAETLHAHASATLQQTYLENIATGRWGATMAITEPNSGSDLSGIRTRAVEGADGSYAISGTKIFISYGDHDLTENIVHLVLGRLDDAPEGTSGLSLFVVPKLVPLADGGLQPNNVQCLGIETKTGLHGSPTCTMAFGAGEASTGWMIGGPNRGLACMFVMMNRARLAVATQGVGIAERAFQMSYDYAASRLQGRIDARDRQQVPLIRHADVKRNLMKMRSLAAAGRCLMLAAAEAIDAARGAGSQIERASNQALADILTPVAKAFCTQAGVDAADLAIQVHGGAGYVEESGVPQLWRDARVTTIYEGTNAIHAIDLLTRGIAGRNGAHFDGLQEEFGKIASRLAENQDHDLSRLGRALSKACADLSAAVELSRATLKTDRHTALAGSTPLLELVGLVAAASYLAAILEKCPAGHPLRTRLRENFVFFALQLLPETGALLAMITAGRQAFSGVFHEFDRPVGVSAAGSNAFDG
ncbi:acyl-CoA dehydrogenase [Hoeflea alexandrii]|uniref:acyl-CoA dehydrogenase n=1 Tax=Hoeflea alexandrii TaxID=288436 RepID=UPI0022AFBC13|nr:acyl-CoA dehydrogenase [Hoeflea alexandrii]MCZ4292238.1 acyl-CoA dehydrogenase [Hoeflea alexandrii]